MTKGEAMLAMAQDEPTIDVTANDLVLGLLALRKLARERGWSFNWALAQAIATDHDKGGIEWKN